MNPAKQYVYTMNEAHADEIRSALLNHKVIYVGNEHGFSLSGATLGGDQYIISKLQENFDKTRENIANICKLKNV